MNKDKRLFFAKITEIDKAPLDLSRRKKEYTLPASGMKWVKSPEILQTLKE